MHHTIPSLRMDTPSTALSLVAAPLSLCYRAYFPRESELQGREEDRQRRRISAACCTNLPFHVFWLRDHRLSGATSKRKNGYQYALVQVKMEPLPPRERERDGEQNARLQEDRERGRERETERASKMKKENTFSWHRGKADAVGMWDSWQPGGVAC